MSRRTIQHNGKGWYLVGNHIAFAIAMPIVQYCRISARLGYALAWRYWPADFSNLEVWE